MRKELIDPRERKCYEAWHGMKQRCGNPNKAFYNLYGGRGIKVCARWESFDNFIADMGVPISLELSLDRINPDGDYESGNCRWATSKEQVDNLRERHDRKRIQLHFSKTRSRWIVRTSFDGEPRKHVGCFRTYCDAVRKAQEVGYRS